MIHRQFETLAHEVTREIEKVRRREIDRKMKIDGETVEGAYKE